MGVIIYDKGLCCMQLPVLDLYLLANLGVSAGQLSVKNRWQMR